MIKIYVDASCRTFHTRIGIAIFENDKLVQCFMSKVENHYNNCNDVEYIALLKGAALIINKRDYKLFSDSIGAVKRLNQLGIVHATWIPRSKNFAHGIAGIIVKNKF